MTEKIKTHQWYIALLFCFMHATGIAMYGQHPRAAAKRLHQEHADSIQQQPMLRTFTDSLGVIKKSIQQDIVSTDSLVIADSIAIENQRQIEELTTIPLHEPLFTPIDSLQKALPQSIWVPNPTKATWLALVIPGGGQIYNRKYWKLPIIYGGFAGCAYALAWNNNMYKDYSQAYKDAVNGNMHASSITDLIPPGYIDRIPASQLTDRLRRSKDRYRRYRDMSIFAFIGVYLISVIDAYVDAELSNFDITPDLSMRIEPTMINNQSSSGVSKKSVGVQCSLRF